MGIIQVLKASYKGGRKGAKSDAARTLDQYLQSTGRARGAAGYGGAEAAKGVGKVVDAGEDILRMPAGVLKSLGVPIAVGGPLALVVGVIALYGGYNWVLPMIL